MYKYRWTHWSNSKFAKWIYKKYGIAKPPYATSEDWCAWENMTHEAHPFVYKFVEEYLDNIQDIVYFPLDVWDACRVYLRNRFVDETHNIRTKLTKGRYHELDTKILHGLFELLVDFVEVEKANMLHVTSSYINLPWWRRIRAFRYTTPRSRTDGLEYLEWERNLVESNHFTQQAMAAREIYDLYIWWKDIRPNRPDPHQISGWTAWCEERMDGNCVLSFLNTDPDPRKTKRILNELSRIECEYRDEDEHNLMRLIKIRHNLYT